MDRRENRIEIFNNFIILVLSYCLFCFTDFVPDANGRYSMGYVMAALTILNIIINLFFVGQGPFRKLKLRCKQKMLIRKAQKEKLA